MDTAPSQPKTTSTTGFCPNIAASRSDSVATHKWLSFSKSASPRINSRMTGTSSRRAVLIWNVVVSSTGLMSCIERSIRQHVSANLPDPFCVAAPHDRRPWDYRRQRYRENQRLVRGDSTHMTDLQQLRHRHCSNCKFLLRRQIALL